MREWARTTLRTRFETYDVRNVLGRLFLFERSSLARRLTPTASTCRRSAALRCGVWNRLYVFFAIRDCERYSMDSR